MVRRRDRSPLARMRSSCGVELASSWKPCSSKPRVHVRVRGGLERFFRISTRTFFFFAILHRSQAKLDLSLDIVADETRRASRRKPDVEPFHVGLAPRRSPGCQRPTKRLTYPSAAVGVEGAAEAGRPAPAAAAAAGSSAAAAPSAGRRAACRPSAAPARSFSSGSPPLPYSAASESTCKPCQRQAVFLDVADQLRRGRRPAPWAAVCRPAPRRPTPSAASRRRSRPTTWIASIWPSGLRPLHRRAV